MTKNEMIRELQEEEDFLLADGFDDAFIGVTEPQPNRLVCAVYDSEKCINILMKRDGMSYEEAVDFFEFNITGSYMGDRTPVFLYLNSTD